MEITIRGKTYSINRVPYLQALQYSKLGERFSELEQQILDPQKAEEYTAVWNQIVRLMLGDRPELDLNVLDGWEVSALSVFFTRAAVSTMRKPEDGNATSDTSEEQTAAE